MAQILSKKFYEEMKKLEPRYPSKLALLLPALHAAQAENGWLSPAIMDEIAAHLGIHPARVRETASFYTMFSLKPAGKYVFRVCTNAACCLRGGDRLLERLEKSLGVTRGETTPDKRFTILEEECLGACGGAPAMMVDEVYYENVTFLDLDRLLERLE
jgi:NADH-quinone oxidoreductase subunit E